MDKLEIAERLETEVRPLLDIEPYKGGYDCCGCSTYDDILNHAIAIVLSIELPKGRLDAGWWREAVTR